jgi:magnesium chelatase subunit I
MHWVAGLKRPVHELRSDAGKCGRRTCGACVQVTEKDVRRVLGVCLNHRLRKDVLDDIDSGIKVQIAWQRLTDPKAAEKARLAKEAAEQKAAAAAGPAANGAGGEKKAGSWSGLPF